MKQASSPGYITIMLNNRTTSLFGKLMSAHAAVVLGVVIFTGVAFFVFTSRYLESEARNEMERASLLARNIIRQNILDAALLSRLMSNDYFIKTSLGKDGREITQAELKKQIDSLGADFISIAGKDGVVLRHATRFDYEDIDAELAETEPLFLYPSFQNAESTKTAAAGIEPVFPGRIAAVAVAPVFSDESTCGYRDIDEACSDTASARTAPSGYVRIGNYLDERFVEKIRSLTGTETAVEYRGTIISATFEITNEAQLSPGEYLDKDYLVGRTPITSGQRHVAYLITIYPKSRISEIQESGLLAIALIAVLAFAFSVLASASMSRRIVEPLDDLAEGVSRIETGDFAHRIPETGKDEFSRLAKSFNRMGKALERRDEEIRLNQEQLIESGKLAAIGELAAGVAHEIGNPLAAISGYLQLLRNAPPEKFDHYIIELDKEVGFIDSTIRELLDFSRPGGVEKKVVDVAEAVKEALRILMFHKIMKYVDVNIADFSSKAFIVGSRKEIIQAVMNISLNAAQAMKGKGTLSISCDAVNDNVVLRIRDTGPGISEEDLSRIFDPFFTTKRAGTGLGLSITFRIVKNNNGKIDVKSTKGEGTSFVLTFPACNDK